MTVRWGGEGTVVRHARPFPFLFWCFTKNLGYRCVVSVYFGGFGVCHETVVCMEECAYQLVGFCTKVKSSVF